MHVYAVSTPRDKGWRWRIMNAAGECVEESRARFASISMAVAEGSRRLAAMKMVDRSVPRNPYRLTTHLRSR